MSEHDQSQGTGRAPAQDEKRTQDERPERGAARGGERVERGGEQRRGGERGGRRRHGGGQQQQQGRPSRRTEPSLNMDELRELAELFSAHGLTDFEFENEEIRVRLSRQTTPQPTPVTDHFAAPPPTPAPPAPVTTAAPAPVVETAPAEQQAEDLHIITSPIVGTFYRAPSPQAEVFVKQGSHVDPDTVVCIIEAMKLMNEIQAETSGTVEKIYVENGQPVEYGQPLFGVKK